MQNKTVYDYTTPIRKSKSQMRARALLRVSTLLSHAYTLKSVANIILNEVFSILCAHTGDIALLKDSTKFEVIGQKGYPDDFVNIWPDIPPDTPLLTTLVIRTKRPIFVRSVDELDAQYEVAKSFIITSKAQSAALLPLKVKNKIIGLMEFTFKEPQSFTQDDKVFMATLGNLCAQAIERVLALEKLLDSKKQLEIILKNTADGIIVCDSSGVITYANSVGAKLCGYANTGKFVGMNFRDIISKYEMTDITNKLADQTLLSDGKLTRFNKKSLERTIELYSRNGDTKRWLQVKSIPIKNQSGKVKQTINTIQDVTLVHELDERKDDFISIASHELRTPLTSLSLFIDMLARNTKSSENPMNSKLVRSIKNQTNRLSQLVSDLLDVSKIQKGKLQFQDEIFQLDELVADTVEEIAEANKHFTIHIKKKQQVRVKADKLRIYQVLTNLITNAMKYSLEKKEIIIKIEESKGTAVVTVQDFGKGVPKEHIDKIFNRFYQIRDGKDSSYSGLGMGLFISNEIVKHYTGELTVKSEIDKGSTFCFALPCYNRAENLNGPK